MIYLTRRYRFSASHRLHSLRLSEPENQRIYGKCSNPGGHGHNYALEVTVAGEPDPRTGMVVDLTRLDAFVEKEILERFDLSYLNDDRDCFAEKVPTTENLCMEIYHRLRAGFGDASVDRVRLEETSLNSFTYRGEEGDNA
ncbi:MAG TPA: 6-carboxytetrahydropterin synthase [Candidatus Acidoferrales bacterium]|nr:6-carboxytetrahydropterin synthase [Candidatus Acidoferrales bacterium]